MAQSECLLMIVNEMQTERDKCPKGFQRGVRLGRRCKYREYHSRQAIGVSISLARAGFNASHPENTHRQWKLSLCIKRPYAKLDVLQA